MTGAAVPFVRRVQVRGFRSIAECDVSLGPLTVLLGFNASGKTNFLDALRFVRDALFRTPQQAVERRGGFEALLHRTPNRAAESVEVRLTLGLRMPDVDEVEASYGLEIGPDPTGEMPLLVLRETGAVELPDGRVSVEQDRSTRTSRLRLPASTIDDESPLAVLEAALWSMRFYELESGKLNQLEEPNPGQHHLGQAGEQLGPVLGELAREDPVGKERLDAYLSALVPGALGVDERREGRYSTVQARFQAGDGSGVATFLREELSEGTLRAAGVLAALFQPPVTAGRVPLVAIEEPETALHPAGVGALYEALDDAAARTQVIVTSQSSDLLDSEYARLEHIRAVANVDGLTRIGEVDAAGRAIVDKGLMTISELHRSGQLRPELSGGGGGAGR